MARGVTLIELILVAAILGILAATVIPRFHPRLLINKEVETASKALVADLRLTRQLALSNKTRYYLQLNTGAHTYALYQTSVSPANQVGNTRTLQSNIGISGDSTFGFEANGSAIMGQGTAVTFSVSTQQWTVTVTVATGRITWRNSSASS